MKGNMKSNYYEAAEIQMQATYSGKYRTGNRASDRLAKYNKIMSSDFENYKSLVKELKNSEHPNVVIWISGVAMDNNFETDVVINRLKEMAEDKKLGIIRFNAEMVLKTRNLL